MNTDDLRIINECLKGRRHAFGELVRRYENRLYNGIYRVVGNVEDAKDVVQEAFLNAYQSLNSFKGDAEFFTWLYRIAYNAAISLQRKRKVLLSLDYNGDEKLNTEPQDLSDLHQPGDRLERSEEEAKLQKALNKLSPEHRIVLVLKEIEGQKYEDIADILDVPIGTIRSRLHRARIELREILEAQEDQAN